MCVCVFLFHDMLQSGLGIERKFLRASHIKQKIPNDCLYASCALQLICIVELRKMGIAYHTLIRVSDL
jgi:hypothetical protein